MTLPLTPAMRQYVEIKSRYRDCILFFRMGDFYEMFFEDAIRASRLLDIALTARDKESNIPMCGVPHHAWNAYLSKLIRQGCKVAICEQIEEPGQKGLFRREVTEVVTPGLVFSEECLDARGNNFLAAVRFRAPFAYAALDATTGEFFHETCDTEEALADALFRIAPAEFVALEGEGNPLTGRGKRLIEGKLMTLLSPTAALSFEPPPGIAGIPPQGHPAAGVVRAALHYLHLHQPAALAEITRWVEAGDVFLTGQGAEDFALEQGVPFVPRSYFWTEKRWKQLEAAKRGDRLSAAEIGYFGTVGATAIDKDGNIAAITPQVVSRGGYSTYVGANGRFGEGRLFFTPISRHEGIAEFLTGQPMTAHVSDVSVTATGNLLADGRIEATIVVAEASASAAIVCPLSFA